MKKIFAIFLSSLMLCSVLCVNAFAADTPTEAPTLELEYMDFYENEDYYMNLVVEQDYALHYTVPDEYQELERERLSKNAVESVELVPALARGVNPPTQGIDAAPGVRYPFSGTSNYSDLYTNNYYTGATHYVVSIENKNYSNPNAQNQMLRVQAYNVISSQVSKTFGSGTTVTKYTMNGNEVNAKKAHFYLCFKGPMTASGYILASSAN